MGYIYMLTSPSGKSYIGQTYHHVERRFRRHQIDSSCSAIYRAIKKYGWENIERDWYECPDEDLNFDEELLVREMRTLSPDGYNLREGGGANGKHSEESKQKNRESHLGKKQSEETKQKIREANVGNFRSEETKKKMSEARRGEKHHMYGKKHTDDSKKKIIEASTGRYHTEETKQKISEAKKGEKHHKSKRVYQYDMNGTLLCSFGSAREAGRSLGKDGSSISRCVRGAQESVYGYKWSCRI